MQHQDTKDNKIQQRQTIMEKTQELLDSIHEHEDYVLYHKQLEELKKSPELYGRMQDFRRKNLSLQLLGEDDNSYHKMQELYQEYKDTLMDPMVSHFMMAEQSVCKIMRKVQDQMVNGIEIDTTYMDE